MGYIHLGSATLGSDASEFTLSGLDTTKDYSEYIVCVLAKAVLSSAPQIRFNGVTGNLYGHVVAYAEGDTRTAFSQDANSSLRLSNSGVAGPGDAQAAFYKIQIAYNDIYNPRGVFKGGNPSTGYNAYYSGGFWVESGGQPNSVTLFQDGSNVKAGSEIIVYGLELTV